MHFLPIKQETVVSDISCNEIIDRLEHQVFILDPARPQKTPPAFQFNGMRFQDEWRFSLASGRSNNFLPLAHLRLLPEQEQCLVQITYRLFPSSNRALMIWSCLSLFTFLFFTGLHAQWLYGTLCLSAGIVNYFITRQNFRIQVGKTSRLLHQQLFGGHH
jgi:hypothetical protein